MTVLVGYEKPSLEEALAHHGVKGMKWGVRKENAGTTGRLTPKQKDIAKKVALGTAVLLVLAGALYTGQKLHSNGSLKLSDVSKSPLTEKGKEAVTKQLGHQTDIIYATRGKNRGMSFLRDGGIPHSMLSEYENAFGADSAGVDYKKGHFARLADGKVVAAFMDPDGKKDFAGREIPHQMIIPKSLAQDLNSLDDVKTKVWPEVKDKFSEYYTSESPGHG